MIDFLIDCVDALADWRLLLMIAVGVTLCVLLMIWVPSEPLNFVLGGLAFAGCLIHGLRWQRAAERQRS